MSNQICAIVITYNGVIPTDEQCNYLCALIDKLGISQYNIGISVIDQKSLTELIGKEIAAQALITNNPKKNSDDEAVKNAIIFLGTIFAEELKKGNSTKNYSNFALSLSLRLHDEKVKNAVEILATRSGKVSKELLAKYKMSAAAFEVIRDIHGFYPF
jgi:hypothetical protein